MPEYLAPGVYIEETSFRAKSIEGVSTTTTGFIGPTRYGPVDLEPDIITSLVEFEHTYGDGQPLLFNGNGRMHNYMWHAVRAFFEEGGKRLYIARAFTQISETDEGHASVNVPESEPVAGNAIQVKARFPGTLGNHRVSFTLNIRQNLLSTDPKDPAKRRFSGLADYDVVGIFQASAVPPASAETIELRDALKALASNDPAGAKALALSNVEAARNAAVQQEALAAAAARTQAELQDVVKAREADLAAAKQSVVAATGETDAASRDQSKADNAQDAADAAKKKVDNDPNSTPAEKLAAQTAAEQAKNLADAAKARYDAAKDALKAAQTEVKNIEKAGGLLPTAKAELAAAETKATTAQTEATKLRTKAEEITGALSELTGIAAGAVTGQLYLALYDATAGSWEFRGNDDTRKLGEEELNPDPSVGHKVCVITVKATVITFNNQLLEWSGLPLDPRHSQGGKLDSLWAFFADKPGNLSAARSLPIVIELGQNLKQKHGIELAGLLFDQQAAIRDNTGIERDPKTPYQTALKSLAGGNDGQCPDAGSYEGKAEDNSQKKTGLKLFEDIEDISIVAAPGVTFGMENEDRRLQSQQIIALLLSHCQNLRYRIAVLDCGDGQAISEVRSMRAKMDSSHGALYYPWIRILDPITRQEILVPPSGAVAGIYARNDVNRAVYKAPANEVVNTAIGFEVQLNKSQQEVLNPEGINCFRFFEGRGFRLWGARTVSSDSEWKYVNVRRYFAYLERSIDRGTQWAVFEPNGEQLWANIKRTIEDFLLNEWQSGALLGDKPEKSFFVKCDRSTMTQNDLDNGRLICLIGVAPLKPAEFVIFRIGQWTADRKI